LPHIQAQEFGILVRCLALKVLRQRLPVSLSFLHQALFYQNQN
jgi:hypothetical protein